MIEMTVGQENAFNITIAKAKALERFPDSSDTADKATIDEMDSIFLNQEMMVDNDTTDLKKVRHLPFLSEIISRSDLDDSEISKSLN